MMVFLMTNYLCRFKKYPVTDQRHFSVKMKQRQLIELQSWFLASIVLSASVFVPAYASPRPSQPRNALGPEPVCLDCANTGLESYRQYGRQDDGLGGIGSIISLGIKLAPTLIQLFSSRLSSPPGSFFFFSCLESFSLKQTPINDCFATFSVEPKKCLQLGMIFI